MVQSSQAKRNALHELGYKIFLDRYAQKDMTRATLAVGDTVIVVVNSTTGQREVGKITALNLPTVTIELLDGEVVTRDIEHIDKPLETEPEQMMDRVAAGIAQVETSPEKQAEWAQKFRWLLDDWKFVPGGRILAGAGTEQVLSYFNCYVLKLPHDSRGGILKTLGEMTEIMSRGGGVGITLSSLRPRHAYVKGVNGRSSGAVSWGALYSFVTGLIEQGGCFGPNERIATSIGLIPAAELADRMDLGEVFYTHTHKGLRRVTARFRNGIKALYEVTTKRGYKVRISEDHKVAVLMDGKITTMALKYLRPSDEILLLLGKGVQTNYAALKPVHYERSIMSTTLNENVRLPEILDEELAYLIGYAHGDGYVQIGKTANWSAPKALKLATADAYPEIRNRLVKAIENIFGLKASVREGDGACQEVTMYSRLAIEWMIANGLLKAKADKIRVPEAIFRSPSSVMAGFIAGYFDADGCNRGRKGGYGIDSISLEMLEDIQQLLAVNGIVSRIGATDRSKQGWQTIHRLTVTGGEFKSRFAAFVPAVKVSDTLGKREMYNTYPASVWNNLGARTKYRQRIYDGVSNRISFAQLGQISERLLADGQIDHAEQLNELLNTMPDQITSIELIGDSQVYDFEVEDVHLLSGGGIYTSNSRRGALMLLLSDWHPDVFEFINSKRTAGQITNANISVSISDKLMDAVKNDADWHLVFPDTADPDYDELWDGDIDSWQAAGHPVHVYKTIKARELWDSIIQSAWASAEPGLLFLERCNKMANSWFFSPLVGVNPCGEEPLPGNGICNLGAINLSRFYDDRTHDVNWDDLGDAVHYATRFLDNVVDANPYFFDEIEKQQLSERRIGLGTMGLAELMIRLGIRYGSDESIEFIDKLYGFMTTEAYLMSSEIAHEKGSFPMFEAEKFLESGFMQTMPENVREAVQEKGIRNVTITTVAPTGTTGTLVNTSTGVEPFFSWVYYRKSRLGLHEEQVPLVREWHEANPGVTELPDYFVTAMTLAPKDHVRVQGAIQRWIDAAISKTANLPNEYTVEQVSELYQYMYELGCKGGTVYRDGSRSEQVLMLKGDERAESEMEAKTKKEEAHKQPAAETAIVAAEKVVPAAAAKVSLVPAEKKSQVATPHRVYPRPAKLQGVTINCATPFGTAYITMNSDEHGYPFEVFITAPGKAGSDLQADAEGLGRMISLSLRTTDPHNRREMLKLIIDQLRDIGGSRSIGFGERRVISLPDSVARAMEDHYFPKNEPKQLGLPMTDFANAVVTLPAAHDHDHDHEDNLVMNGMISGADMCPSCGTISLVRAEGCRKCLTCGYSEC